LDGGTEAVVDGVVDGAVGVTVSGEDDGPVLGLLVAEEAVLASPELEISLTPENDGV
jgi:hypothetical protein